MKLSPVDLNLLAALDAVLQTRSVGKAASMVGLSKPAMSHALARLRSQMNDPILVRAGQKWILSERAEDLSLHVRTLVASARSTLSPTRVFDEKILAREFRVHATDHVLSLLGLALGHAVTLAAPRVTLRFLPVLEDDAAALRDNVDLAIGVFRDLPADLRQQVLFREDFACVVRSGHPTIHGKLSLGQFLALQHVIVAPRGRPGGVVDDALHAMKLSRRVVRAVPYFMNAIEFVADSDCVVTMPAYCARKQAKRFDLQVLSPPIALIPMVVSQIWHPRVEADPSHIWLRKRVAEVAATAAKRTPA